jgi:hypothetical protein
MKHRLFNPGLIEKLNLDFLNFLIILKSFQHDKIQESTN